ELTHHRAGRMRHIGVERRAEEGEAASHRRPHIGTEAKRSPRHLRHAGQEAIELDRVEPLAVAADEIHYSFQHRILRVTLIKLVAQEIVARLLGGRAAEWIDEAV